MKLLIVGVFASLSFFCVTAMAQQEDLSTFSPSYLKIYAEKKRGEDKVWIDQANRFIATSKINKHQLKTKQKKKRVIR